jgi:type II secretory ATPase GspE/PulE/Tfp pilus assembly ATPase PilB-like protein
MSENIQSLIASRADEGELLAAALDEGNFTSMREDAARKIRSGVTTLEEAAGSIDL